MAGTLTGYDGCREDVLSGDEVLEEIFDLIRHRLPRQAVDDPVRASLLRLAPLLNRSLGGSSVRRVASEGSE